jgi:hypothetical protein
MATMIERTRTREDIIADLQRYCHDAGRMTIKDARYEKTHLILNGLLAELEWLDG